MCQSPCYLRLWSLLCFLIVHPATAVFRHHWIILFCYSIWFPCRFVSFTYISVFIMLLWKCAVSRCYRKTLMYMLVVRTGAQFATHLLIIEQDYGLGLDASVSRPSRGAVVPQLGLSSVEISNASVSPRPRDWMSWSWPQSRRPWSRPR